MLRLRLLLVLFCSLSLWAPALRAQLAYASWDNSLTGWTDQSGAKFAYSYSTTKGVTQGSHSLVATAAANPGWSNLLRTTEASARTAIVAATSIKLDVFPEAPGASFANVTLAMNGSAGGWTQLETKTVTLGAQNSLTWELTAGQIAYANSSTGWFEFWIIVQTDAPIIYHFDNLRFASSGTPPVITAEPVNVSAGLGATATFGVTATGSAPLSYQWYANGVALTGANAATLSLPCVQASDAGAYTCVVGNGAGNDTSAAATLTVGAPVSTLSVTVNVDAATVLRTVDDRMFGANVSMWDDAFSRTAADGSTSLGLLRAVDMQTLRFPGGSLSDDYDWSTGRTKSNNYLWPLNFEGFMAVAAPLGAEVFLTANYGTGTHTEAAAWVQYANVTKGYGIKYWEVGNECYGSWEADNHDTRGGAKWDPVTYAIEFKKYFDAMKAVDATIKIGAVATAGEDELDSKSPVTFVTNPRTSTQHKGWTPVMLTKLKELGVRPDYLIYHRYDQAPGQENDADLLQDSSSWSTDAAKLRQLLTDYLGAGSENVELVATENNSVYTTPGKQSTSLVNGLFMADSIGNLLKTEFRGMHWWALRNGRELTNNNSSSLYGWRNYGDYGMLSANNERFPTYRIAKLLSHFARGGDSVVGATSTSTLLSTYAVKRVDGTLSLLVLNKSPQATASVNFSLAGFNPAPMAPVLSYGVSQDRAAQLGAGHEDIAAGSLSGVAASFTTSFPPYSATLLRLHPAGGRSRLANISVRAASGSGSSVLIPGFWVGGEGTSGTLPVLLRAGGLSLAPYGVPSETLMADPSLLAHRLNGAVPEQIGSNDDWGQTTELKNLFGRLWAYDYGNYTKEAALVVQAGNQGHTFYAQGTGGGTGVVLAEVYDASENPGATTPRLVNISGRAQVGTGAAELIGGFIIIGNAPKTVLIRAVGPSLPADIPQGERLATPHLSLHTTRFSIDEVLAQNTAWAGDAAIKAAATKTWAQAWPSDASKDAALLVTLPPGAYTAVVKGLGGATGVSLVEIFEVE